MRVLVQISQPEMKINETFSGNTAEEVVGAMKSRVAKELPFALRIAANAMSNVMFVQEVVKRYNANQKQNLPIPTTCQEFLTLAQEQGFARIEA